MLLTQPLYPHMEVHSMVYEPQEGKPCCLNPYTLT